MLKRSERVIIIHIKEYIDRAPFNMKELYCVSVNITELVELFSGHLQPQPALKIWFTRHTSCKH